MVTEYKFRNQFNSTNLAKKDPFSLDSIDLIKNHDKINYYSGIISCCLLKILESSNGFDKVSYQPCGEFVVGRYFFNKDSDFTLKEYAAYKDCDRFHKGDIITLTQDYDLDQKVKNIFNVFKEIEQNNWKTIQLPNVDPKEVYLNIVSDISSFSYIKPINNIPFFIFDFYHPDEKKTIIKGLENDLFI